MTRTSTPNNQSRENWEAVLVALTKKQEMQQRYNEFMERNAHWLLGLDCFVIGVLMTNAVYQLGLVGFPALPDLMISVGAIGVCGTQATAAFKALKRRGDSRD